MTPLHERWAAYLARRQPEELYDTIRALIAREGYLSAEDVMAHIETALNRLEKNEGDEPTE